MKTQNELYVCCACAYGIPQSAIGFYHLFGKQVSILQSSLSNAVSNLNALSIRWHLTGFPLIDAAVDGEWRQLVGSRNFSIVLDDSS